MKNDISNRQDLYRLVQRFYEKLFEDSEMEVFFLEFKEDSSLEKHLAVLVDFWDGILFYSGAYKKNAIQPHLDKNKEIPFEDKHFKKWISLFSASIDELFKGEVSEIAKSRAQSIATVMQIKIMQPSK